MSDAVDAPEFRSRPTVQVELNGFEGPLDLLLDLARRQAVDIAKISAIDLADQFLAATSDLTQADLPMVADWLVMAAWLVWLKSRLLLPKDTEEARQAEEAAQILAARLEALERVRAASEWLERQPRLGRDFFGRGFRDEYVPIRLQSDYVDLLQAALSVLRIDEPPEESARCQPPLPRFWTPHQAMARMRQLMAEAPAEHDLLAFVPGLSPSDPNSRTQTRAAIASTLIAGLELTRGGEIEASQTADFGPITISAPDRTAGGAGTDGHPEGDE
jgi:segregation and condensation protein A